MHELGLCSSIVDAIERRAGERMVARVRVQVGRLHHVHPEAFGQSFAVAAMGTVAEDAAAELIVLPVCARCGSCTVTWEAEEMPFACPTCGSVEIELSGGDELVLELIEYEGRSALDVPRDPWPGRRAARRHEHLARVDVSGVGRIVNIGLLEDEELRPGDWVLIHVGFAMSKIDEAEAAIALASLQLMGQAYDDELEAFWSRGSRPRRSGGTDEPCASSTSTATRPPRARSSRRSPSSPATTTSSSWRCAAGIRTRSTGTASSTCCPTTSSWCTGRDARCA